MVMLPSPPYFPDLTPGSPFVYSNLKRKVIWKRIVETEVCFEKWQKNNLFTNVFSKSWKLALMGAATSGDGEIRFCSEEVFLL